MICKIRFYRSKLLSFVIEESEMDTVVDVTAQALAGVLG